MNNIKFSHYTTEYISGVMSLRTPQKRSLEILADIVNEIKLKNRMVTICHDDSFLLDQ